MIHFIILFGELMSEHFRYSSILKELLTGSFPDESARQEG